MAGKGGSEKVRQTVETEASPFNTAQEKLEMAL